MEQKTHTTAVVLVPPVEIWPPIQAIRQRHDRNARRWMPHITLIYPFRPRGAFDAVAPQLADVCAQHPPLALSFARFGSFQHAGERSTIWLAPEPAAPIVDLQTALWRVVPDCDDVRRNPGGFTPHLSVGQAADDKSRLQLLMTLQATWQPLNCLVPDICLIWRDQPPDDTFRIARRIKLGS